MAYETAGLLPSATLQPYGQNILKYGIGQLGTPINVGAMTPQVAGQSAFQQAGAQRVADMAGLGTIQRDATGQVTGFTGGTGVASFQPFMQQAAAGLGSAMGTTALGIPSLQAAQQQFDPTTARTEDFMNQYQSNVTQEALKQLDEQAAKAQSQLASQAQKAGAFGGARFGVQEAELAKNLQDIKSKRIFEDLSKNFMQAQQAAIGTSEAARARELQAAPVYGQLGQTAGTQALGFGNLGAQQFGLGQQGIQSLLGVGQTQRTRDQALFDEDFRFRTAQSLEPRQRIQFGADILAGTPSVQQSITQQPIPYTNPLAAAVGGGLAGAGGLGAFYSQ